MAVNRKGMERILQESNILWEMWNVEEKDLGRGTGCRMYENMHV